MISETRYLRRPRPVIAEKRSHPVAAQFAKLWSAVRTIDGQRPPDCDSLSADPSRPTAGDGSRPHVWSTVGSSTGWSRHGGAAVRHAYERIGWQGWYWWGALRGTAALSHTAAACGCAWAFLNFSAVAVAGGVRCFERYAVNASRTWVRGQRPESCVSYGIDMRYTDLD